MIIGGIEFKKVGNTEGFYWISACGKLYSTRTNKILKYRKNPDGYLCYVMCIRGHRIDKSLHRIVAESWISNQKNKPQINHIDGNKLNNSLSNLEWVTLQENNFHAVSILGKRRGNNHKNSKITSEDVCKIREMDGSLKSIGEKFGIGISQVFRIKRKETWAHIES